MPIVPKNINAHTVENGARECMYAGSERGQVMQKLRLMIIRHARLMVRPPLTSSASFADVPDYAENFDLETHSNTC